MSNSPIWPTDWILSGATTPAQKGHGSDGNKLRLKIDFVSYPARAEGLSKYDKRGYSAFSKSPALLEQHHQIFLCYIQDTRWGEGVLPLCGDAVGVFYIPSRLGNLQVWEFCSLGEFYLCRDAVSVFYSPRRLA